MNSQEHSTFAIHVMLKLPPDRRVPNYWFYKGVPKEELDAALARGADPAAIEFLSDKNKDPRLYALRELGWIRTAKSKFNCWQFNQAAADLIRDSKDYWTAQDKLEDGDVIDVEEFAPGGQKFTISVKALRGGGRPEVLRGLSGLTEADLVEASIPPNYSTLKYTQMQRDKLYHRTGDNPTRRRR